MRQFITRVFPLAALLLVLVWVFAQPQNWAPALLRWWAPQLELRVLEGLRWQDASLRVARLALRWQQHDVTIEALSLRMDWAWPLPVVQSLEVRELVYRRMGASANADSALQLPRFWEQPYWRHLGPIRGAVERFDVRTDDTLLLTGSLSWSSGLQSADAELQWAAQTLQLGWQPLADRQWRLTWQLDAGIVSAGHVELRWEDPWLDWRADATLQYAEWQALARSSGKSQAFDTQNTDIALTLIPADGGWSGYRWQGMQLDAQVTGTPQQWQLQSAQLSAATLFLRDAVHGTNLSLNLGATGPWPLRSPWPLPCAELSVSLESADPDLRGELALQWHSGELVLQPVLAIAGSASGTLAAQYGQSALPELQMRVTVQTDLTEWAAQGQLDVEQAPRPIDFSGRFSPTEGLRAEAVLDGPQLAPEAWTAFALAPAKRFLPTLQTLQFQPQLMLSVSAGTAAGLQLDVSGQISDVVAATDSLAVSGAELGPFVAQWRDQQLRLHAPWQIQALRAGVELQALQGELHVEGESRQVRAFSANVLGGSIRVAQWDWREGGIVALQGLDLGAAVGLLGRPEIEVTGTLNGELPVSFKDGGFHVQNGRVFGVVPGTVRYQPAGGQGASHAQPLAAVYRVLSNLHYDVLDAGVTYRPDGELVLTTRIEGRNPDMQPVQPVHLNLNVEQNVLSLLRSLRAADNVNRWLERRFAPTQP